MPSEIQVQNTLLSAGLILANKVLDNTTAEQGGNFGINWWPCAQLYLNIKALQRQFNAADYNSDETLAIYACLNALIGYDSDVNVIDPNYQPPSGNIVVVNPASYLSPIVITWADMSTDGSPDGGITKITYYNTLWAGINPFLSLVSPSETGIEYGTDYTLIVTGGFVLSLSGNVPGIVDGQKIWATAYALA